MKEVIWCHSELPLNTVFSVNILFRLSIVLWLTSIYYADPIIVAGEKAQSSKENYHIAWFACDRLSRLHTIRLHASWDSRVAIMHEAIIKPYITILSCILYKQKCWSYLWGSRLELDIEILRGWGRFTEQLITEKLNNANMLCVQEVYAI